jgi:hypothetical protein
MADQFNLSQLLGGGLPAGLLSQVEEAQAAERARNMGLLNFAFGALQASRGAPGTGRPSLGQVIGQAGPLGVAGYQQSFEDTLKRSLQGMQIAEMRRKQQEQEAGRAAMRRLSERLTGVTPEGALAAPGGQVGPTVERAEMIGQRQPLTPDTLIREAFTPGLGEEQQKALLTAAQLVTPKEPKETFRELTTDEKRQRGYPVDVPYQISSTGKVSAVDRGPLVVFPQQKAGEQMWIEVGKKLPELATQAGAANQTNQALSNLIDMGEKKTFSGLLAPGQVGASQFLTSMGIKIAPETLANTRTFQAATNVLVLDFMASMGGARGFSKEESAILYDAFPKLIDDPLSRTRIAKMLVDRNNRIIREFQTTKSTFEKATGATTPFQQFEPLNLETKPTATPQLSNQQLIDRYLRR